jgi:hypothetical protein
VFGEKPQPPSVLAPEDNMGECSNGVTLNLIDKHDISSEYSVKMTATYWDYIYLDIYKNGKVYTSVSVKKGSMSTVTDGESTIAINVCSTNENTAVVTFEVFGEKPQPPSVLAPTCDGQGIVDLYAKNKVNYTDGNSTIYTDYCIDSVEIKKYWCLGNQVSYLQLACPSGYACSDGACVVIIPPQPEPMCVGPSNYNETNKSSVTYNKITYTDYCVDNKTAMKYWCSAEKLNYTYLHCTSGYYCSDGTCVENVSQTVPQYCKEGILLNLLDAQSVTQEHVVQLAKVTSTYAGFNILKEGNAIGTLNITANSTGSFLDNNTTINLSVCWFDKSSGQTSVTIDVKTTTPPTPPSCTGTVFTKDVAVNSSAKYSVKLVSVNTTYATFEISKNSTLLESRNITIGSTAHIWDGNTSVDVKLCSVDIVNTKAVATVTVLTFTNSASTYSENNNPKASVPQKTEVVIENPGIGRYVESSKTETVYPKEDRMDMPKTAVQPVSNRYSLKPTAVYWGYAYVDIIKDGYVVDSMPVKAGGTAVIFYDGLELYITLPIEIG